MRLHADVLQQAIEECGVQGHDTVLLAVLLLRPGQLLDSHGCCPDSSCYACFNGWCRPAGLVPHRSLSILPGLQARLAGLPESKQQLQQLQLQNSLASHSGTGPTAPW